MPKYACRVRAQKVQALQAQVEQGGHTAQDARKQRRKMNDTWRKGSTNLRGVYNPKHRKGEVILIKGDV